MLGAFESSLRRRGDARGSPTPSVTSARTGSCGGVRPSSAASSRSGSSVQSVSSRLYRCSTLASAAKTKPRRRPHPDRLLELTSKVVKTSDFKEGKRVSQLITLEISGEEARAGGALVVRRRRSLPNIRHADGGSGGRRRRHGYQRRLGSDGSSGSSSPPRCESPPLPAPQETALRRSSSVPAAGPLSCAASQAVSERRPAASACLPAAAMRKLNGKSFMDLTRILEEQQGDGAEPPVGVVGGRVRAAVIAAVLCGQPTSA